jgi:hypothetical protein
MKEESKSTEFEDVALSSTSSEKSEADEAARMLPSRENGDADGRDGWQLKRRGETLRSCCYCICPAFFRRTVWFMYVSDDILISFFFF